MNILLLGSGGREHALAWRLSQSTLLAGGGTLYAAPGNPGIAAYATCAALDATDHGAVLRFCAEHAVGLVVIGPEAPLCDGLADSLRGASVPVFGPGRAAAQLEGSKGFTKDMCATAQIPTAAYQRVASAHEGIAALERFACPVVVKADGLAAGKGVIIAETREEAEEAIRSIFDGAFGTAGAEAVIEEFMTGEEASFFALTDGRAIVAFASAQDHKRVGEGDTGPNTGGMGAYSPARVLTPTLEAETMARIIAPTVKALADAGTPYSGVLFAGLMLTEDGPKLIEFNARFGDPECQALLPRLQSDLLPALIAACDGELADFSLRWRDVASIAVVLAARGYPEAPQRGSEIGGLDRAAAVPDVLVFHAGTQTDADGHLRAAGGRVLTVCATGADLAAARHSAYAAIGAIEWPEGFYRRDIGWRALAGDSSPA